MVVVGGDGWRYILGRWGVGGHFYGCVGLGGED